MRMSERVVWSVWLRKQGSVCTCMCVFVCAACMWLECLCARMHVYMYVVGGFCCFSTYVGFSICRLCCYHCVSMETLSRIAALRLSISPCVCEKELMCVARCNW